MAEIINFADFAGRKRPEKKKEKEILKSADKLISRHDQVKRLVMGKLVEEIDCIDDENFSLIFDNGAKLNLMISIEHDLMEIINIIESGSLDE